MLIIMNNQFVPYDIAKDLKDLGFDELCIGSWLVNEKYTDHPVFVQNDGMTNNSTHPFGNPSAPLWQQVTDWLYEKHGIFTEQFINKHPGSQKDNIEPNKIIYSYRIYQIKPDGKAYGSLMVDGFEWTPNELREKIIRKALKKITPSENNDVDPIQYSIMGKAIDNIGELRPSFKTDPIPDVVVKSGDFLDHQRFGKGTVIGIDGDKCMVKFDDGIVRKLISKFAGFKNK
jgi:hypothetical protein